MKDIVILLAHLLTMTWSDCPFCGRATKRADRKNSRISGNTNYREGQPNKPRPIDLNRSLHAAPFQTRRSKKMSEAKGTVLTKRQRYWLEHVLANLLEFRDNPLI